LGMAFRQIRDRLPAQTMQRDFAMLSISFDPQRDDLSSLKAYGNTYGADGKHWRIARVQNAADLKTMLSAFGVVVIPDGLGGFEHNAAIQLIGRNGKLIRIVDIDNPLQFADRIATWR
jgi:protein SCO1